MSIRLRLLSCYVIIILVFKSGDKMKDKIKSLDIIHIIMTMFAVLYAILKVDGIKMTILAVVTVLITSIGLYYLLKKMISKNVKLEYIYLLFAIVMGSLYMAFLPATKIPDSRNDYLRSLEVSEFNLVTPKKNGKVGRYYSTNIDKLYKTENAQGIKYKDVNKLVNLKLNDEKKMYTYATKSLYAFVCYIPQAIGVGIGRVLGLSIYMQTILGKIFNYLLFMTLIFLSIKYIPIKKELLFFIALLPMTVQEALSLSPDSMTIATSICLVSFIIYFKYSKEMFTRKYQLLLFIISVLLSMCKIVYLPLCFLIFLIPKDKYKSEKEKNIYCILLSLIVIVLNLTWLKYTSRYLTSFIGRSDSSLQLKYILSNPIKYCFIILNTVDMYSIIWLEQLLGVSLGIYSIPTFSVYIISSAYLLIMYTIRNEYKKIKEYVFNNIEKIFIFVIAIGTFGLICTSLYLQWTSPYATFIDGIQGRYFIPLILLVSMLFMTKESNTDNRKLITYTAFINIMAIISVISSFM